MTDIQRIFDALERDCTFENRIAIDSSGNEYRDENGECVVWAENILIIGFCSICLQRREPIYENNGFDEPDPTHYEITGFKPCKCQEDL